MPCSTHHRLTERRAFLAGSLALGLTTLLPFTAQAHNPDLLTLAAANGKSISFTEEDYAALPWQDMRTHTFWTEGPQAFRGPLLRDVLLQIATRDELQGRTLLMRALNDFSVEVPADDAWDLSPLLAREMNGKKMRVRDKGPLWLVYPRDADPEAQSTAHNERWIWQLRTIQVV